MVCYTANSQGIKKCNWINAKISFFGAQFYLNHFYAIWDEPFLLLFSSFLSLPLRKIGFSTLRFERSSITAVESRDSGIVKLAAKRLKGGESLAALDKINPLATTQGVGELDLYQEREKLALKKPMQKEKEKRN